MIGLTEGAFLWSAPAASSLAGEYDLLLYSLLGLCALVGGAVALLIVVFSLRYRRGSPAPRRPRIGRRTAHFMEIGWMLVPLALFLGLFAWGGKLYLRMYSPPADALVIQGVAKQWMWKFQHPGGQREINRLHVPAGHPVRLRLASQDVIHSFYVPAFRVKRDVLPWHYSELWFEAEEPGRYHLLCAEYCGTEHSAMRGQVVVLAPQDYARWLEGQGIEDSPAQRGEALFRAHGCSGCHGAQAQVRAPDLDGLYGRPVPLASGGTVRADETYLRDAILQPQRHVVAGYAPVMPAYAGQIDEAEIFDLIAYLRSLEASGDNPRGEIAR